MSVRVPLLVVLAAAGACTPTNPSSYIAHVDKFMLVALDGIERLGSTATARVHYVLARPRPLADSGGRPVSSRVATVAFDCQSRRWGDRDAALTLADGQVVATRHAEVDWKTSTPTSMGGRLLSIVCDAESAKKSASDRTVARTTELFLARNRK